jgi:hypothetical protein
VGIGTLAIDFAHIGGKLRQSNIKELSCSAQAEHPVIATAAALAETAAITGSSAFADDDNY